MIIKDIFIAIVRSTEGLFLHSIFLCAERKSSLKKKILLVDDIPE